MGVGRFLVCRSLFIGRCLLGVLCCGCCLLLLVLLVVRCSLRLVCCSFAVCIVRRVLFVVCCWLRGVFGVRDACCMLGVVCCL